MRERGDREREAIKTNNMHKRSELCVRHRCRYHVGSGGWSPLYFWLIAYNLRFMLFDITLLYSDGW